MSPDELRAELVALVLAQAPEVQQEPLSSSTRLVDDLGFTSVDLLELATEIALVFDLEPIGESVLADISTVDDLVSLVADAAR